MSAAGSSGRTFPAPITFSAAYTALEQRGQRSLLPNFWENLLAVALEEVGCGLDLDHESTNKNAAQSNPFQLKLLL